jgi:hypothetical protein
MRSFDHDPIPMGKPNWAPLEMLLHPSECEDYMYMGRTGDIELYKHRWTRRYLNISSDSRCFYRLANGTCAGISKLEAIRHVSS